MIRFVPIKKAAKKRAPNDVPDHEKVMLRAADGRAPSVSVSILDAFNEWKSHLDPKLLEELIRNGALDKLDMKMPWQDLEKLLADKVRPELWRAVKRGADDASAFSARVVRNALGVEPILTFDGSNPRVDRYIEKTTANLVTRSTRETREAIKQTVRRMMTEEVNPTETFRAIKRTIGLDRRRENALANYRAGLIEQKATGIKDKVDAYADKLLKDRARTIARTETMDAINQGQLEGIRQAKDQGTLGGANPQKQWIVTNDDVTCPTCVEMANVSVPLHMPFTVKLYRETKGGGKKGVGQVRVDKPPAHPNCRCTFILTFDGDQPLNFPVPERDS